MRGEPHRQASIVGMDGGAVQIREPGAFECEYLHHVSSPLHRLLGLMPWEIPVLDVKPLGPEAARAVVRSELTPKGPQAPFLTGRNVVILQKVGPDWRLATHLPASSKNREVSMLRIVRRNSSLPQVRKKMISIS